MATKSFAKVKYIVVYHTDEGDPNAENYRDRIKYRRGFIFAYQDNIENALCRAEDLKRPGTNIFIYKVNLAGRVKPAVDWKINL